MTAKSWVLSVSLYSLLLIVSVHASWDLGGTIRSLSYEKCKHYRVLCIKYKLSLTRAGGNFIRFSRRPWLHLMCLFMRNTIILPTNNEHSNCSQESNTLHDDHLVSFGIVLPLFVFVFEILFVTFLIVASYCGVDFFSFFMFSFILSFFFFKILKKKSLQCTLLRS